ncbi:hypothetical protein LTR53_003926 [Teratosphaeriaceae sp. CCFEE 6253]|nr:hypothetical protein LTR53_003926 [Teratosphaeriaceae sp. CCFEE 6253]
MYFLPLQTPPFETCSGLLAVKKGLKVILPVDTLPRNLLLVNRQLCREASDILYNSYLFNIVGTKTDCLAHYTRFLRTMRRYARSEVNINAFSNGDHSATMCLTLQAGDLRMPILNRRARGQPIAIQDLREEQKHKAALEGGNRVTRVMTWLSLP